MPTGSQRSASNRCYCDVIDRCQAVCAPRLPGQLVPLIEELDDLSAAWLAAPPGRYLGEVLLAELTMGHVQAMFAAIIRQHQALGTPVSAATLTRIRATLRAALNAAIRRG